MPPKPRGPVCCDGRVVPHNIDENSEQIVHKYKYSSNNNVRAHQAEISGITHHTHTTDENAGM